MAVHDTGFGQQPGEVSGQGYCACAGSEEVLTARKEAKSSSSCVDLAGGPRRLAGS